MKSSGRTPYEVRLELLQLSFEILRTKHAALGSENGDNTTTYPSTEDVIAEAERLNDFVSNTNQQH